MYEDKADVYNQQLQRLSNWFRLPQVANQPDATAAVAFFQRLCCLSEEQHEEVTPQDPVHSDEAEATASSSIVAQTAPDSPAAPAAAAKLDGPCVTLRHFFVLAPKLGEIYVRCDQEAQREHGNVDLTLQRHLRSYLRLTPVTRMEATLQQHFPSPSQVSHSQTPQRCAARIQSARVHLFYYSFLALCAQMCGRYFAAGAEGAAGTAAASE